MDIPPEMREGAMREGPALVGGLAGAMLAAQGIIARVAYFIVGYLLARFAGPFVANATHLGDLGVILAGALGLLTIERLVALVKGIDSASIAKTATERIKQLISRRPR